MEQTPGRMFSRALQSCLLHLRIYSNVSYITHVLQFLTLTHKVTQGRKLIYGVCWALYWMNIIIKIPDYFIYVISILALSVFVPLLGRMYVLKLYRSLIPLGNNEIS